MWRRIAVKPETLASFSLRLSNFCPRRAFASSSSSCLNSSSPPFHSTAPLFSQQVATDAENTLSKGKQRVEDVMPIATGLEREELEAELEGRKRFDLDPPTGPFGTKEAPAIIQSYYNKRIVGCPGGEGEDEHDVVWFWLEKDKPHECPVCFQNFKLEVIGEGGSPDGHGDDGEDHHH
ncbi:hypothetical protein AMTR_s00042p00032050 [Amborella trichopoda]|uniref:Uncharacterized protein n=1 Tax=Amborella trichopoda TaxID=13333 RepID=W1P987_AMBTC|nr:hypothetical protein AMTR_s00042p00032050 [Amborella trichopoda]